MEPYIRIREEHTNVPRGCYLCGTTDGRGQLIYVFIGLPSAFNRVRMSDVIEVLKENNVPQEIIKIVQEQTNYIV